MDDTVGSIISAFAVEENRSSEPQVEMLPNPSVSYARVFDALVPTTSRINVAIIKYRSWLAYAQQARHDGRGKDFTSALERESGSDFNTLVTRRIELLRKLGVRIKILREFKESGFRMLCAYDYPSFFTLFMAPVRDVAIAVNDLYSEVVRGALASHQAFFQVCRLMGEENGHEFGVTSYDLGRGAGKSVGRPESEPAASEVAVAPGAPISGVNLELQASAHQSGT